MVADKALQWKVTVHSLHEPGLGNSTNTQVLFMGV
jgi:hypothetical protein